MGKNNPGKFLVHHDWLSRSKHPVFGLPGGEVVELLDAFRKADIEFVLVKNESTAVNK
jgi:hypothetical protein